MKKLNYLLLLCMMAISTWSYAQCTGNGGTAVNTGAATLCPGDMTSIVLAGASAPSMGDVSGYSWVISNAAITGSTDPLNDSTYVAGLPITATPAVTLMEVLSDYVSDAGTYYLTSVAFGNGTWTGADMNNIGDVTLDPDCTFTGVSAEIGFGGATCPPSNNECAGAIDLSSSLGQGTGMLVSTGPYDNTLATTEASDPTEGYGCFGEPDGGGANPTLENTLWFKVTGDGNLYFIEATTAGCSVGTGIDDNDTQIALYTGSCGMLTPLACNEDGSNASNNNYPSSLDLQTEDGVEYYIMVDGFNFNGVFSDGEFCMQITEKPAVACSDPNVGVGILTAVDTVLCQPDDDAAFFAISEGLAPTEGDFSGYLWTFSTQDLAGTLDPSNAPGYLGAFPITSELQDTVGLGFSVNMLGPDSYYATLYIFGNATADANGNLVFDENCTFVSNSARVDFYSEATCPMVNVLEVNEDVLGMTVFPNPVQDVINLNVTVKEQLTEARLMITNLTGQIVKEQFVNLASGTNTFNMDVNDIPSGIYIVSIESDTHQSVTRFVKR